MLKMSVLFGSVLLSLLSQAVGGECGDLKAANNDLVKIRRELKYGIGSATNIWGMACTNMQTPRNQLQKHIVKITKLAHQYCTSDEEYLGKADDCELGTKLAEDMKKVSSHTEGLCKYATQADQDVSNEKAQDALYSMADVFSAPRRYRNYNGVGFLFPLGQCKTDKWAK